MAQQRITEQVAIDHARADLGGAMPVRLEPPQEAKQGTLREMLGDLKEWWNNLHIGDGHLPAWLRLGGHEMTQALAAFPGDIRPMEEPGVFGNPTPQIVTQEMGARDAAMNDMPFNAADYARGQPHGEERGIAR
jgi:hypothetical protein